MEKNLVPFVIFIKILMESIVIATFTIVSLASDFRIGIWLMSKNLNIAKDKEEWSLRNILGRWIFPSCLDVDNHILTRSTAPKLFPPLILRSTPVLSRPKHVRVSLKTLRATSFSFIQDTVARCINFVTGFILSTGLSCVLTYNSQIDDWLLL